MNPLEDTGEFIPQREVEKAATVGSEVLSADPPVVVLDPMTGLPVGMEFVDEDEVQAKELQTISLNEVGELPPGLISVGG